MRMERGDETTIIAFPSEISSYLGRFVYAKPCRIQWDILNEGRGGFDGSGWYTDYGGGGDRSGIDRRKTVDDTKIFLSEAFLECRGKILSISKNKSIRRGRGDWMKITALKNLGAVQQDGIIVLSGGRDDRNGMDRSVSELICRPDMKVFKQGLIRSRFEGVRGRGRLQIEHACDRIALNVQVNQKATFFPLGDFHGRLNGDGHR